jgi:hypothetical protein
VYSGALPLVFNQTLQLAGRSAHFLGQPTNYEGTISFTPSTLTNQYATQFQSFSFEYPAFDVPELGFSGLKYQVLDPSGTNVSGFLDLNQQVLQVPLPSLWLDASSNFVTTSFETMIVHLTQYSSSLVDLQFSSQGTFGYIADLWFTRSDLGIQIQWQTNAPHATLQSTADLTPPIHWEPLTNAIKSVRINKDDEQLEFQSTG